MMLAPDTQKDIDRISEDILRQSGSWGVYPTPVDQIVDYSDFYVNRAVNLSVVDQSFLSKLKSGFAERLVGAMGFVRGILDRKERVIYLDTSVRDSRQNFVKLHEVGHGVLPWQQEILSHLDDDEKLDGLTDEEFEAEANYFASSTLFQGERFTHEAAKLNLELNTALHLAKTFGGSNHAALRRYVETSQKRCALLVLNNKTSKGGVVACSLRNFIRSSKFEASFGQIIFPETFGYTWSFARDYCFGKRYRNDGEIELITSSGKVGFTYHFFNNTFNGFVLLFPKGEQGKPSRTKIIYTGAEF